MGEDPAAIRQDIEATRERMGDTVEAIGYKVDVPTRAKEAVTDKVEGAKSAVSDTVGTVRSRVSGAASRARDAIGGTADRTGDAVPSGQDVKQTARRAVGVAQSNPLGLAIGAAALGFLAGMLAPSTRMEDEKLGPVADQVKQQAAEVGQEAVERGRQVAQQATQAATETARQTGREHAEQLADSAKDSTQEVRSTAETQLPT
jgi:gas vesicle protein